MGGRGKLALPKPVGSVNFVDPEYDIDQMAATALDVGEATFGALVRAGITNCTGLHLGLAVDDDDESSGYAVLGERSIDEQTWLMAHDATTQLLLSALAHDEEPFMPGGMALNAYVRIGGTDEEPQELGVYAAAVGIQPRLCQIVADATASALADLWRAQHEELGSLIFV
ncbi:MAG TPA: hypothetical protein VLA88_01705 [Candidatus Saccharimonadales bacterium]|nr:hypothetical protein [Candidatus Saccharimonadales bacterium]